MAKSRLHFSFKVYRRSFRRPVRTSHGVWEVRDGILLRVESEDGQCGFGEIAPIERFGTETLAGAIAWCASLGRLVTSARLRDGPRGMPCCAAAVAAALNPPGIGDGRLAVACLLPTGEAANEELARGLDAGFTTFKLKIGTTDFTAEEAHVSRLVEQLPAGARLRLDANGGLDLRAAVRWLDAATAWPVEFIEQPLPVTADRDVVRLARDHAVPIALDESVRNADDIKRWRDHSWPGVFVIKPVLAGAPDDLMAEIAITPDRFVFSSALESAIGAASGLRLAFAAGVTRALGYGVAGFFEDDGLGGGWAKATIAADELRAMDPEDTWNRL